MKTKSPAFPLLAIAFILALLLGLALYTAKLLAPIAHRLAVALLETLKTYLRAVLQVAMETIEAVAYYCYPQGTENVLDVLTGMIVFDVCIAIAYVCNWGCRICE